LSEVEEVLEAGEMCITKGLAICNVEWAELEENCGKLSVDGSVLEGY
jgi:hypothetical protein